MIKKLLFTVIFLLLLSGLYAQKVSFGVDAGLNLSKLPAYANADGASVSVTNKYLAGFHAGGLVDIKFGSFTIQPGVMFTIKGGESDINASLPGTPESLPGISKTKVQTTLDYIEIPLNLMYRIPAGAGEFFFGAGPYIAVGLSGKATVNSTVISNIGVQTYHQSQNITFGSGDNDIQNPDVGFNALVGYELKEGLTFNAGYGQSFNSMNNGHVKNEGFSFSLRYFFK